MVYVSKNGGVSFNKVMTLEKNGSTYHELIYHDNQVLLATSNAIYNLDYLIIYTPAIKLIDTEVSSDGYVILIEDVLENEVMFNTVIITKDFLTLVNLSKQLETVQRSFKYNDITRTFKLRLSNIASYSKVVIFFSQYSTMYKEDLTPSSTSQGILKYQDGIFSWVYGHPFKDQNSGILSEKTWNNGVYGPIYGMDVLNSNPNVLVFSNLVGIYTYQDGLVTPKHSDTINNSSYRSSGIDVGTTYSVQTDPFDSNHLLMPATDFGLIKVLIMAIAGIRLIMALKMNRLILVMMLILIKRKKMLFILYGLVDTMRHIIHQVMR